jgi:hypothetical protein
MKVLLSLFAVLALATVTAEAGTRCVKDFTGAVVCTDTSSGQTTRCVKDFTGAIVCN